MSIFQEYVQAEADKKKKAVAVWLEETAANANKCQWATHVAKYVNPSVEGVNIVVKNAEPEAQGYVCTGNTKVATDIAVSANYLAVAKLLTLELEDGQTVYEHFRQDTDFIRREMALMASDYDAVRNSLLKISEAVTPPDADERLRQVFFPVGDGDYHLLTLLPPSALLMELKKRIDLMEQEARGARDSKADTYGNEHRRLLDLTALGIGGTKPQNISYLNNKNGGRAYMLSSLPPMLAPREVIYPKQDFFANTLRLGNFRKLLRKLHKQYMRKRNNVDARRDIREVEQQIIDEMLCVAYQLQERGTKGWTDGADISLPMAQKIWLDSQYQEEREDNRDWVEEIATLCARWIFTAYKKIMQNQAVELGNGEFLEIRSEVEKSL